VQHLVMLQYPMPSSSRSCATRSPVSIGFISTFAVYTKCLGPANLSCIW